METPRLDFAAQGFFRAARVRALAGLGFLGILIGSHAVRADSPEETKETKKKVRVVVNIDGRKMEMDLSPVMETVETVSDAVEEIVGELADPAKGHSEEATGDDKTKGGQEREDTAIRVFRVIKRTADAMGHTVSPDTKSDGTNEYRIGVVLGSPAGVQVLRVQEDTPAAKAQLRQGDVILKLDGEVLGDPNALRTSVIRAGRDQRALKLLVLRGEELDEVTVMPLAPPPAEWTERRMEAPPKSDSASSDAEQFEVMRKRMHEEFGRMSQGREQVIEEFRKAQEALTRDFYRKLEEVSRHQKAHNMLMIERKAAVEKAMKERAKAEEARRRVAVEMAALGSPDGPVGKLRSDVDALRQEVRELRMAIERLAKDEKDE